MNGKLNNVWMRGIFSLVMGVFLVTYPGKASLYFVQILGALFFIPGLVALFSFFRRRSKGGQSLFPIVGLGSFLLGLWLIVEPNTFVSILMYVLGVVLVLAGLSMISNLFSVSKQTKVPLGFYFVPILVLIAGIVVLVIPFAIAEIPFIVLGVSIIVYALFDMFNAYKFRSGKVENKKDESQVKVVLKDQNLLIEEKEQSFDEIQEER